MRPGRFPRALPALALVLLLSGALGPTAPAGRAWAQEASAAAAAEAPPVLDRAREALDEARDAPGPRHPDAAPWERALDLAQEALAASRGTPWEAEALALLARLYGDVRWWSRAVDAWSELRSLTGELDEDARSAWRHAAMQVAVARYAAGDLAGAERRFRAMLEADPEDAEALSWLGRIALEEGRLEEAATLFERLVGLRPDDEAARYHLELARERLAHGQEASAAFRRGLAAYEEGRPSDAIAAFDEARAAAPDWIDPAWWRARTLLEAGRSEEAVAAWEDVAAARPDDPDAAWFLDRARLEARVGREAVAAADEARAAREAGDPAAAVRAWTRAVEAAPEWTEARVRLGRAALEAGDTETARSAFRTVLDRAPGGDPFRAEARAGLERVGLQERLGPEAGTAYGEALEAYERGEMETAEARLQDVVRRNPDFADAWGWLGRLAFARGEWSRAAEAYARASTLEPGDDDYAFFAQEARRLAGEPEPDDPEDEP